MKNLNLIGWLSRNSHEKQKPQRFARFAAMLILLLTLGVGQAWGASTVKGGEVYFDASQSGWSVSDVQFVIGHNSYSNFYNMSAISNTQLYYISAASWSDATYFAFANGCSSWGEENNKYSDRTKWISGKYSAAKTSYTLNSGSTYLFYTSSSSNNASINTTSPAGYLGARKTYADLNYTQTLNQTLSTNGGSTYSASTLSLATVTVSSYKLNGESSSTADAGTIETDASSTSCEAARSATVTYSVSDVTTGYDFVGWYDGSTQKSTSNTYTYIATGVKTITARFKQKQYTVSYGVNSSTRWGNIKLNSGSAVTTTSSSTLNHGTTISFTATPNSGYQVEGWYSDASCTVGNRLQEGGTSYNAGTLTAAKTVYVKFKVRTGGTITLSAGANGEVSADNSTWGTTKTITDVTTATDVNIYARGNTGYQFSSWTKSSGSGTIKTNAASGVFTTVAYEDATVTASFTERMSTLTTSNSYDAGDPSYAAPTVSGSATNVGYATTRTITATAAGTGYTFAGWTLTNCTRTDGGAATATSITIRSNGDGAAATVVANYNEVLTTNWYITGATGTNYPFTGWGTSGTRMSKKSGHSTEEIYYCNITVNRVASGNEYEFQTYNHGNTTYYGYNNKDIDKEHNSTTVYSNNPNNMRFKPYVTGTYEFKLDNTGANPVLTVTWPVFNQVRISAASPSDASNVGNYDLSEPVSNVRTVTRSLKANTTYTFKIVYNSDWYGYNSGTFTRSTSTSSNSRTLSTSSGNLTLTTDYAGDYTFRFNQSTKALSVDFPTAYKVTYGKGTVDGSSSNCSAKDIDNGNASVTSNSTWVKSGNRVVLTAPVAKTGYTYDGWFDNNSGTGDAITTNANCTITVSSAETYYACYHENLTAVTITTDGHGTITTPNPNESPYSLGVATMQDINASANTGYHWNTWTVSGTAALNSSAATQSNKAKGDGTVDGTGTVTAMFSPNTYRVHFHRNGGAGEPVYQNFTYDVAQNLTANSYTKTGYSFAGWALSTGGDVKYANSANVSNLTAENGVDFHLYAKWTPNPYTVVLDKQTSAEGYGGNAGTVANQTVTFDATPATVSGTMPTAAQGYGFMGFYSEAGGNGRRFIDPSGNWVTSAGDTISGGNWVKPAGITLYAYYKKAEITNLVAEPGVIAPGETITITPTIEPTPTGTTKVCYELQYSNGTPLPSQPTFTPGAGNAVSFPVPSASATYIIQATLAKGSSCPADPEDVLSTRTTTFQVAGSHTVTVRYQDSDGRTLKDTIHITARPLDWTTLGDITPPTITGYKFDHWDAGDGVTIKNGESTTTTTTTSSIQIKATYDGTLTAVYAKKRMIYFNNTLGWSSVYVYFYKNDSYWQTVSPYNGSGANTSYTWTNTPYSEGKHGQMLPVSEGSNIYYFDAEAAGVNASYDDVVFTEADQHGEGYFHDTKAVRRGDYKTSLPMFVPVDQTPSTHNKTDYYNKGYWMNYPENTGYTLKIYNAWNATKETAAVQSIAFPYSEDLKMPLKMDVELSDGYNHDYWFMVYRNDGTYMGSAYHFKQGYQDEQTITGGENKNKITTSAPGNYTFILTYHGDDSNPKNYNFYIDVDFPIASGDYRIYYSDNATWSKAAHTKESWCHPSHSIGKATTEAKKDTISFYIPKGVGISHTMKFQKASVTNEGVVTWDDVDGGSITIPSSVTTSGVYNFIVSQPAGGSSISLEKVEPYTGNFYIRTDCAGNTKWDSFKNVDHQMTYSDYAEEHSGYSHYYTHWVTSGTNVKFCIANDYSMCITDTLVEDKGTVIANITAEGNDGAGRLNSASANIRFMWNQSTNKVSRAYIGGSTNISDRFLVLEGDSKMYDKDGSALSISGLNPNEANLIDDQNFVYEREIQVNTKARAKLTAKYNTNIQYFKGSEGAFAEGTTIELLGGDAIGKHTMRIVYDFKTNRLVTAYVPSGTIDADIAINADLMIVREHQGTGQQLLFEGEGALSEVHTVYGVMRFNRWTLNNKEKTGEHSPVGDPKSIYERSLYWISFPFDVNLSDVFGFGTYGVDWIIEYYDGAERATNGYWVDSDGFWKMVMPAQRADFTLEAGKGYVLAIDIDAMKDNNKTFWANNIEQVELFFPSATNVENITQTTAHTIVPEHECTIDRRTDKSVNNINKDRTKADSHWNMIGIPSYANYGATLTSDEAGTQTIRWNSNPYTNDLPFLYEWNMTDDSYTVQSGTTYPFKAMHAYMVQYHGDLYWSLASATPTPSPIVARRAYAEKPQNAEFRLELQQNEKMVDQTFVNMKDAEEISAGFKFDEDLCKEFNAGKANIYTLIENYLPAAGNTLPMSDQTTLVPVGVKTTAAGEYTFAMPESTNGVSVVLIDNIAGTRTNLALSDYTVSLGKGDLSDRFMLEIAPIKQMPTGIDAVSDQHSAVRKVMIDGILYIVKDGKVFDARGAKVK